MLVFSGEASIFMWNLTDCMKIEDVGRRLPGLREGAFTLRRVRRIAVRTSTSSAMLGRKLLLILTVTKNVNKTTPPTSNVTKTLIKTNQYCNEDFHMEQHETYGVHTLKVVFNNFLLLAEVRLISLGWFENSQIDSICFAIGDEFEFQHRKKNFSSSTKST